MPLITTRTPLLQRGSEPMPRALTAPLQLSERTLTWMTDRLKSKLRACWRPDLHQGALPGAEALQAAAAPASCRRPGLADEPSRARAFWQPQVHER